MHTSTVQCLPRFPPYYPTILHYIHNLVDLTQSWYSHLSINSCILFIPFCATLYITADLFKSATGLVAYTIASISKDASVDHELFNPGKGVLVLLRSRVNRSGRWRIYVRSPYSQYWEIHCHLSFKIAQEVDEYIWRHNLDSGVHAALRTLPSAMAGYVWKRSVSAIDFFGIALSRAFDTIRRDKLLHTLQTVIA